MKLAVFVSLLAVLVSGCALNNFSAHRHEYPSNSVVVWNESSNSDLRFFRNGQPWEADKIEHLDFRYSAGVSKAPTIVLKHCATSEEERVKVSVLGTRISHVGFTTRNDAVIARTWTVDTGTESPARLIIVRDSDFN